jgi:hypothetical protein
MGFGLGVLMVLFGLILEFDVLNFNIKYVNDDALGGIFLIVGALAIVLQLIANHQQSRRTVVEERR